MVNVFISVLSLHGVAVTLTFITLVGQRGKGNLKEIGDGEGEANEAGRLKKAFRGVQLERGFQTKTSY
jgi:hypothetical protein